MRIPVSAIKFESCFDEQRWMKMKVDNDERNIKRWILGIEALFLDGRILALGHLSKDEIGISMDAGRLGFSPSANIFLHELRKEETHGTQSAPHRGE